MNQKDDGFMYLDPKKNIKPSCSKSLPCISKIKLIGSQNPDTYAILFFGQSWDLSSHNTKIKIENNENEKYRQRANLGWTDHKIEFYEIHPVCLISTGQTWQSPAKLTIVKTWSLRPLV